MSDLTDRLRNPVFYDDGRLSMRSISSISEAADHIERLEEALKEALDEWEANLHYKGQYLSEKHGDAEEIAKSRELLK
jgi:ArsR family metal-binding transcriptional regulator